MTEIEIFNPETVAAPAGTYSHVAKVPPGATLVVTVDYEAAAPLS